MFKYAHIYRYIDNCILNLIETYTKQHQNISAKIPLFSKLDIHKNHYSVYCDLYDTVNISFKLYYYCLGSLAGIMYL